MRLPLLLVLAACRKHEESPVRKVPPSPTSAEVIALPPGSGEPIGTATAFLRFRDGALVEITADSVFGDRTKPFKGIDGDGNLHAGAPNGFSPAPPHEQPDASPTAVFVDRTVTAAELRPAIKRLKNHCWGFAVNDHGKLEVLLPEPCPPPSRANDRANLDVYVTTEGKAGAAITEPASTAVLPDLDQLAAYLQQQHAKSDYLTGRTDLDLAVDERTTVGQLTMLFVRAHVAGFTAAAWVAKVPDAVVELTR
jgi:hypothetical protein